MFITFSLFNPSDSVKFMTKYQARIADLSISSLVLSVFWFLSYFVMYLYANDNYVNYMILDYIIYFVNIEYSFIFTTSIKNLYCLT